MSIFYEIMVFLEKLSKGTKDNTQILITRVNMTSYQPQNLHIFCLKKTTEIVDHSMDRTSEGGSNERHLKDLF